MASVSIRTACVLGLGAMLWACSLQSEQDVMAAQRGANSVFEGPVARAVCGTGDRPEPGLQGRFALVERIASVASQESFQCNLELIGRVQGGGAAFQNAWHGDCAYVATGQQVYRGVGELPLSLPPSPAFPGTAVIDGRDSAAPFTVTHLTTPAIMYPHEGLKAHAGRGLLGALLAGGREFDLYGVGGDCTQPQLLASATMPAGFVGHEGSFAPDGRTYYAGSTNPADDGGLSAINVDDSHDPQPITHEVIASGRIHGVSASADGSRGYLSLPDGISVVDLSAIQAREEEPVVHELSRLRWADGGGGQHSIPVTIRGRPYLIAVDEAGAPPGAQRIIDISDEAHPVVVSKLRLEVQMDSAEGAAATQEDCNDQVFCYHSHYCGVDRTVDPTVLACTQFNSGVRVYDIRDPQTPKEIAYFVPPGQAGRDAFLVASGHFGSRSADWCAADVRLVPERGELWTTCMDYGFMVLRFTNGVWPFTD